MKKFLHTCGMLAVIPVSYTHLASVLGRQIGEAPQVPHTYGAAGGSQDETDLSRKMICFLFHNFCTPHL